MNRANVLINDMFEKSKLKNYREKGQVMILEFIQVIAIDNDFSMNDISWVEYKTSNNTMFTLELRLGPKTPSTLINMTTYDLVQYSQQLDADKIRKRIKARLAESKFYLSMLSEHARKKL